MANIRVLVADDHAVVRDGLKLLIADQLGMRVVGEAGDGESVVAQVQVLMPDVVIMDISMPGMNGIETTTLLTATAPSVKVLGLSVHEDSNYARRLFAAGARGYALKRSAGENLIQAVRVVAIGEYYIDPLFRGYLLVDMIKSTRQVNYLQVSELSERETEVLQLIARGYVNKDIAAQLGIAIQTVYTYKTRAMEKLNLHSRAAIVRYVIQQGWLQEDSV